MNIYFQMIAYWPANTNGVTSQLKGFAVQLQQPNRDDCEWCAHAPGLEGPEDQLRLHSRES